MSGCQVVRVGLSRCLGYRAPLRCQFKFAPENFEIVLYMHILWTGFVVYKIPGSGIFSGVFRIWKMWMCWVCGVGPQTTFWCIYDFENVGAPGLWDRPRCIFGHFENVDAWVCGENFPALLDAGFLCFNRSGAFQQYQYTYIIHHSQLRVFLPLEFTKNLGNRP